MDLMRFSSIVEKTTRGFPRKSEHAPQIVLKQSLYDKKPEKKKQKQQRSDQWGPRFSILQESKSPIV